MLSLTKIIIIIELIKFKGSIANEQQTLTYMGHGLPGKNTFENESYFVIFYRTYF